MLIDLRAVNRFVATGRPTGALLEKTGMVDISNEKCPGGRLLLEMALQTERLVPLVQHPLINRAMGRVAAHATVAHSFMLVNEWAALRGMTLEAGLVFAEEGNAAAYQVLLHAGAAPFDRPPLVWIVAIGATHFAFEHWVMMR